MNPIGEGLGSGVYDSGFVTILWQLGWFGGFLYLGGLTWILWTLVLRPGGAPPGSFETIVLSIIFAYFGMMIFGRQILEVVGCAMWTFIGLAFAARRHRSNQPETPPDAAAAATASIASSPDSSPASDRLVPS
jgi:hypothetical protein